MSELIQKSLTARSTFGIKSDRVSIVKKGIGAYEEFALRFDQLGFDVNRKKTSHKFWGIPFLYGFAILSAYGFFTQYISMTDPGTVVLLLCTLMFAGIGTYALFENTNKVYLVGGTYSMALEATNPSREAVDQFISDLHQAMRAHHRERWGEVNPYLGKNEQAYTFQWLLSIDAISQPEYEDLMEQLKIRDLLN